MRSHGLLNLFIWLSGGKLICHHTMLCILIVRRLCAFTCEKFLLSMSTSENCEITRLCSSRARWPLGLTSAPSLLEKLSFFHRNHMLGTLDFTGLDQWAPFSFSKSTSLNYVIITYPMQNSRISRRYQF